MNSGAYSRRDFSLRSTSLVAAIGFAGRAYGAEGDGASAETLNSNEISHANAAIHQEVTFAAPPSRIFQTLTVAALFDRVVQLSSAMNSDMKKMLGTSPTQIDARQGGAFTLFGGYVTGRNIELVPDKLIIQAWRAGSWVPGDFSIARFALVEHGPQTRLVFDHAGFPSEAADHLAKGWHENYWEPLAKSLV